MLCALEAMKPGLDGVLSDPAAAPVQAALKMQQDADACLARPP
jgi:hypothetical protein